MVDPSAPKGEVREAVATLRDRIGYDAGGTRQRHYTMAFGSLDDKIAARERLVAAA